MKDYYFLIIGSDTLDQWRVYNTKSAAVSAFGRVARELDKYGQEIMGQIHLAPRPADIVEYPDFVLSLGPRGGVRVEST